MDQKKIDRLFREKLDSYEVVPSDGAWKQVEKRIGARRSLSFYWVAAAVTLLVVTWVAWPEGPSIDMTPIASAVDHPQLPESIAWNLPLLAEEQKEVKEQKAIPSSPVEQPTEVQKTLVAREEPTQQVESMEEEVLPLPEMDPKTVVAVAETEVPEVMPETSEEQETALTKIDLSQVKITYIASVKEEEAPKADSTSTLKKFIAFAGKLSPGDMLSDIKSAKDGLFNKGLKSKNKTSL